MELAIDNHSTQTPTISFLPPPLTSELTLLLRYSWHYQLVIGILAITNQWILVFVVPLNTYALWNYLKHATTALSILFGVVSGASSDMSGT